MTTIEQLALATRAKWRAWLKANHDRASAVWLVFYKKHTGRTWITYDDAVEEALCYGWVDSLIQRLDGDRFRRKFTPRRPKSKWAAANKKRVATLLAADRLAAPGRRVVDEARQDGSWDVKPDAEKPLATPDELLSALSENRAARAAFDALAPSHRRRYALWIATAKRADTRERRAAQAIAMLVKGERLGLK